MDLFKLQMLFQDIEYCKKLCEHQEKKFFIKSVEIFLIMHLREFQEIVDAYTIDYEGEWAPYLTIEMYESVDEIFLVVKEILSNAAYYNNSGGYALMQLELANLYTPLIEQKRVF